MLLMLLFVHPALFLFVVILLISYTLSGFMRGRESV
jgi:hypothetical protein